MVPIIFAVMVIFFLILLIAPYLSEVSLTANLQADQVSSIEKYQAHATMAALRSNDELMDNLSLALTNDSRLDDRIDTDATESNDTAVESEIRGMLSEQSDRYRFLLQEEENGGEKRLWINSSNFGQRRYSEIYVASPSENMHKMVLGVGGIN